MGAVLPWFFDGGGRRSPTSPACDLEMTSREVFRLASFIGERLYAVHKDTYARSVRQIVCVCACACV